MKQTFESVKCCPAMRAWEYKVQKTTLQTPRSVKKDWEEIPPQTTEKTTVEEYPQCMLWVTLCHKPVDIP